VRTWKAEEVGRLGRAKERDLAGGSAEGVAGGNRLAEARVSARPRSCDARRAKTLGADGRRASVTSTSKGVKPPLMRADQAAIDPYLAAG